MRDTESDALTPRNGTVAIFIALFMLLYCAFTQPGWAEAVSGPSPTTASHAPPSVPQGYVVTPFGYFHPSCVHEVDPGDVMLSDGRIKHADGTTSPVQPCRYERYTKSGARLEPTAPLQRGDLPLTGRGPKLPEADGWLEASWYFGKGQFDGISASWLVPSAPTSDVGQVLYYFPGLEDYQDVVTILQPVLGWNGFNNHAWTISSWNCCTSGNANYSPPEAAATGDTIAGTVRGDCQAGQFCSTWNIATVDKTTGRASTLRQTSGYGQTLDWAFAGVVEVYGVESCDEYSSNGFVDFTAVSLLDINKKQISNIPWSASGLLQDNAPACNYGVTVAPTSASLTF